MKIIVIVFLRIDGFCGRGRVGRELFRIMVYKSVIYRLLGVLEIFLGGLLG